MRDFSKSLRIYNTCKTLNENVMGAWQYAASRGYANPNDLVKMAETGKLKQGYHWTWGWNGPVKIPMFYPSKMDEYLGLKK